MRRWRERARRGAAGALASLLRPAALAEFESALSAVFNTGAEVPCALFVHRPSAPLESALGRLHMFAPRVPHTRRQEWPSAHRTQTLHHAGSSRGHAG